MYSKFSLIALGVIALTAATVVINQQVAVSTPDQPSPAPSLEATSMASDLPLRAVDASPATQAAGTYIEYSSGIIEATAGTKVLFFHAPWCPQCRALEASIKAGSIPAGTTIIKIDYDSNQALRKTYGVTLQTTLVTVNDRGELVKKYVAYEDPSLETLIKNSL